MKYIPNALSIIRILLSFSLLLLVTVFSVITAMSPAFLVIYVITGITDMIDGPLARKLNAVTPMGANLDGLADVVFALMAVITITPILYFNLLSVALIICVFILKFAGMIVGYVRFRQLTMLHTYANKIGAIALFMFPLFLLVFNENTAVVILAIVCFIFLSEETVINSILPEPNRDIKGLHHALQIRRQKKAENE